MKSFGTLRGGNGMKNFGTLYGYELKKLLARKMSWAVVLILAAVMAGAALPNRNSGGSQASVTDRDGNTVSRYVSAVQQVELARAGNRRISGQVMDEPFFERVRAASDGNGLYQIRDGDDLYSYFYLVDSSYQGPCALIAIGAGLEPKEATAAGFYKARERQLALQWADLSEEDAAYWQAMEAQVEKPFVYRAVDGYRALLRDVFGLSCILPLAAAVCVCGVFSAERRTRADALIFSSRHGRFPQYLAKVLAGTTVAAAASALIIGADTALLLTCGADGFDAALQPEILSSSLSITMGQAVCILYGLLLYGILSGGVTMLISVLTGNTAAAMACPVLLMIVGAWLRLDAQAAEYLPNQLFNAIPALQNVHLVHFLGGVWNNLQFGYLLYASLAAALLLLCLPGWRRWSRG